MRRINNQFDSVAGAVKNQMNVALFLLSGGVPSPAAACRPRRVDNDDHRLGLFVAVSGPTYANFLYGVFVWGGRRPGSSTPSGHASRSRQRWWWQSPVAPPPPRPTPAGEGSEKLTCEVPRRRCRCLEDERSNIFLGLRNC